MNEVRYTEISAEEASQRLDNYLLRILKGVPKSHIYRIIRAGEVRVNKKRAKVSLRLQPGDRVRIPPIRTAAEKTFQISTPFKQCLLDSVLYEDEALLVINKPAGMAVHGGSGVSLGVIEALRTLRQDLPYLELVHRLDRETSGCLLLAKKRSKLRAIQALFAERKVHKTYWALCANTWDGKNTRTVTAALEKNILRSGERMVCVSQTGKPSETHFELRENFQQACWLQVHPQTGRTHQIRVHGAYLHHPVIGDEKYGQAFAEPDKILSRQRLYLHARAIQFTLEDKFYKFDAMPDTLFSEMLEKLRAGNKAIHN